MTARYVIQREGPLLASDDKEFSKLGQSYKRRELCWISLSAVLGITTMILAVLLGWHWSGNASSAKPVANCSIHVWKDNIKRPLPSSSKSIHHQSRSTTSSAQKVRVGNWLLPCYRNSTYLQMSFNPSIGRSNSRVNSSFLRVGVISDVHLDAEYADSASALSQKDVSFPCHSAKHVDLAPFNASFGRARCDSPQKLLDSALQNIATAEKLDLLLVTGDNTGHYLYTSPSNKSYNGTRVSKAQLTFADTLSKTFQSDQRKVRVVLAVGNNDVPLHWQIPMSWWYKTLWPKWSRLILCHQCKKGSVNRSQEKENERQFNRTFLRGGYYKVQVTNGLDFLVVNSLYWSGKARSKTPWRRENDDIAKEQLNWLYEKLKDAQKNGRKVVVVGHIPPGLDSHREHYNKRYKVPQFWLSNFTNIYMNLLTAFSSVLSAQLYAHTHKDDFRALMTGKKDTHLPLLLMPAISPVYWNNPAFRYIYFERKNWQLADYTQYWADFMEGNRLKKLQWKKDYVFSQEYPSSETTISGKRLLAIWKEIICSNEKKWHTYTSHQQIYFPSEEKSYSRDHLFCAARAVNIAGYDTCRLTYPYDPAS